MRIARRSTLVLVSAWLAGAVPARGQVVSSAKVSSAPATSAPTKTPTPATAAKTVVLPAAPPAAPGGSPVAGSGLFTPGLPPFVLSQIYYFEPSSGTELDAAKQGNSWVLPVEDTTSSAGVSFLFSSNVPKQEIAEFVERRICCADLLLDGGSAAVTALAFKGNDVFVRAIVPDMRTWPKTVQLRMLHQGSTAGLPDASRASASGAAPPPGGASSPVLATSAQQSAAAPIVRPFMSYASSPATVRAATRSFFATFLYPTFSHARCTDCHSMGDPDTVRAQHAASGVPNVISVNAHVAGCGGTSCHSMVKDWRTPPFEKGINWKGKDAKTVCQIVTSHLPTAEALHAHFHDDPRVLWAVGSGWIPPNGQGKGQGWLPTAPPHSSPGWFQMVDVWINAGFPCPG